MTALLDLGPLFLGCCPSSFMRELVFDFDLFFFAFFSSSFFANVAPDTTFNLLPLASNGSELPLELVESVETIAVSLLSVGNVTSITSSVLTSLLLTVFSLTVTTATSGAILFSTATLERLHNPFCCKKLNCQQAFLE